MFSELLLFIDFLWVILKYATTHSHPQPSTTTQITTHNHPQPPTTTQKTTHNHPQLPRKPPTTIHNYPENHPQPSTTIHNQPKITKKSQDLSQTVVLLHFRCSCRNRRWVLIVIRNNHWYIYMCVCLCVFTWQVITLTIFWLG